MIVKKTLSVHQEEQGQICWDCQNAYGRCSWSRCYMPVKGWEANPTKVIDKDGDFYSYDIKVCPEFIREVE